MRVGIADLSVRTVDYQFRFVPTRNRAAGVDRLLLRVMNATRAALPFGLHCLTLAMGDRVLMQGTSGGMMIEMVMIGPMSGQTLRLGLVEAGKNRRVLCEADVLSDPLVKSVLASAESTIAECRKRDWWSKDDDELVDALAVLKRKGVDR